MTKLLLSASLAVALLCSPTMARADSLQLQIDSLREDIAALQSQQIWAEVRAERLEAERARERSARQFDENIRRAIDRPLPPLPRSGLDEMLIRR